MEAFRNPYLELEESISLSDFVQIPSKQLINHHFLPSVADILTKRALRLAAAAMDECPPPNREKQREIL